MKRLTALIAVVFPLHGHAQSGATDNELYAAYCKGALSALNQAGEVLQTSQRFSAYLFATGVLTDPTRRAAAMSLSSAFARGAAEQHQCNVVFSACSDSAFGKPGAAWPKGNHVPQFQACVNQSSACERAMRCFQPDALPF